jgi:hydroxyethylthiazole kinase
MENADEALDQIVRTLDLVRQRRPLIHIISNFVTLNDVANATLAIGARPVMAHAVEEVAEIAVSARALVLNLGTPSRERYEAIERAGKAARARGLPVVFDPVGVGASLFRQNETMIRLGRVRPTIVRGNADEIAALAGLLGGGMSGVDSVLKRYDRPRVVKELASRYSLVGDSVAVVGTGETDYGSDGKRLAAVRNGHVWLKQITGSGDMLDALIGAAAAVEKDPLFAAVCGLVWFGIAAECAAEKASGLGSFRVALLDALGNLDADLIRKRARFQVTKDEGRGIRDEG